MTLENKNGNGIEYVLGIDFGHGETEAAVCSVDWDKPIGELQLPKAVDIFPGIKVIQSVMGYHVDGRIEIGDAALLGTGHNAIQLELGWKKRPSLMNDHEQQAAIDFMKHVYLKIRGNLSYLTDINHCVCIGHPSGWSSSESDMYLQMAREAGLLNVIKTEESRAALLLARLDSTSGISQDALDKGVLVCDFGSSTLDFTYCRATDGPKQSGIDLGAVLIDKMLLAAALEELTPDERKEAEVILVDNPSQQIVCELKARDVKQKYYEKGEKYEISDSCRIRQKPRFNLDFTVNPTTMDSLLGVPGNGVSVAIPYIHQIKLGDGGPDFTGAWREILRAMLKQVYSHLVEPGGNVVAAVLLTGGASRMSFIIEDVIASLGVDRAVIARDEDPSTAIARGIAYVGRADVRTSTMAREAEGKVLESLDAKIESYISALVKGIAKKATETVSNDVVFPELRRWRDREVIYLSATEENIKTHAVDELQGATFRIKIRDVVGMWLQDVMKGCVRPKLESVLQTYGYQGQVSAITIEEELAASASDIAVDTESLGEILDVSEVVGAIVGLVILTIGHILNVIVAFCVWNIIIYIIASMLMTIEALPLALPLYAGASMLAWELATKGGSLVNKLGSGVARAIGGDPREKDYSIKKRKKIFSTFEKKKGDMLGQIFEQIEKQLLADPNLSSQAREITHKYALSYIQYEIKMARLLID